MGPADENSRAALAKASAEERERFLEDSQPRILRMASGIAGRRVTRSDDEWSAALMAVSEALDGYSAERGDFWSYAAVVMRSRLADCARGGRRRAPEIPVQPSAFDGEVYDDEPDLALQCEVRDRSAAVVDLSLREEIEAAGAEMEKYGFSFFDLAGCSPRSRSTKDGCARAIRAMLEPPPLTAELEKSGRLPVGEIAGRTGLPRRLLDRHRRYLIAASVILSGDYPGLSEYFGYVKSKGKEGER